MEKSSVLVDVCISVSVCDAGLEAALFDMLLRIFHFLLLIIRETFPVRAVGVPYDLNMLQSNSITFSSTGNQGCKLLKPLLNPVVENRFDAI